MKKILLIISMMVISVFLFSSCVPYINTEKAVQRISEVKPDKEIDRVVVGKNLIWFTKNGETKTYDVLAEAEKYCSVNEEESKINTAFVYNDWIYYVYRYDYKSDNSHSFSTKINCIFMRTDIYTGKTENIYDFGKVYISYFDTSIQNDRYYFFYSQGVLKIYDMQTNQFVYEDCLLTEQEIQAEIEYISPWEHIHYSFYDNYCNVDYVKDGEYYRYQDGGYQKISVPEWCTKREGSVNIILYTVENYLLTKSSQEEAGKAYDIVEGVEADYNKVLELYNAQKPEKSYIDGLMISGCVYVEKEEKFYYICEGYSGGKGGESYLIYGEVDENGDTKEGIGLHKEDLKEHSEAFSKLCKLWYEQEEGSLSVQGVTVSKNRMFFMCYTYYGNFFVGTSSNRYIFEIDPITKEFYYIGHYQEDVVAVFVL